MLPAHNRFLAHPPQDAEMVSLHFLEVSCLHSGFSLQQHHHWVTKVDRQRPLSGSERDNPDRDVMTGAGQMMHVEAREVFTGETSPCDNRGTILMGSTIALSAVAHDTIRYRAQQHNITQQTV